MGIDNKSVFTLDPSGNRVKKEEYSSGSLTSTKQFVICSQTACEERDASGISTRSFFGRGEVVSGSDYFFESDYLGSVRQLTNSSGILEADYSFDPFWEKSTKLESVAADFQYAGYYYHSRSVLSLTDSRAYNAYLGRFISRDPVEETGGLNLYAYVNNDPVSSSDPSGHGCNADYKCCKDEVCCNAMHEICKRCHPGAIRCCDEQHTICTLVVNGGGPDAFREKREYPGTSTWAKCGSPKESDKAKQEAAEDLRRRQKEEEDRKKLMNKFEPIITGGTWIIQGGLRLYRLSKGQPAN